MKQILTFLILLALTAGGFQSGSCQEVKEICSWTFTDMTQSPKWTPCQMTPPVIEKGILKSTYTGSDPFLIITGLKFKPKSGQYIEIKLKSNGSGNGELFFTETTEGPYGGFSQKKSTGWSITHDGQWHVYKIYPQWVQLPQIIQFRIDLGTPTPEMYNKSTAEIEYVKICDSQFEKAPKIKPEWNLQALEKNWTVTKQDNTLIYSSKPGKFKMADFGYWLCFDVLTGPNAGITAKSRGKIRIWGSEGNGTSEFSFPFKDRNFTYNFDLVGEPFAPGTIYKVEIELPTSDAAIKFIGFSEETQGSGLLDNIYCGMADALNRSESTVRYLASLKNVGGGKIDDLHVKLETKGDWSAVKLIGIEQNGKKVDKNVLMPIAPLESVELTLLFRSEKAGHFEGTLVLEEGGGPFFHKVPIALDITPSLHLPKASYVPEPKPVKSKYQIGAYYFPGWNKRQSWDRIKVSQPIRKPVLGWYDESNPEVVDWQIKWASETGIGVFLVDWYWNRGEYYLSHWVEAFQKAKYKSYLKWAMMWANHNGPGSHSLEDTDKVTQFWIDNYFKTPEYYTIDGKPVVVIWSVAGMDSDIINIEKAKGRTLKRGEGVKMILDRSRELAKKAGLKGIHFVAMKFPEASTAPSDIQWLADAGFDGTSIYHFMSHGGKAKSALRFPFDLVVDASLPFHEGMQKTGILPYFPNLSTGWDSRPWHGDKQTVIEDRTVEKFKKICLDLKKFVDDNNIKEMITLSPLNEWGEGSYIEPNLEFGFGMYETIRETFCEKPEGGFPTFFGPSDVGLGPYDLPPIIQPAFHPVWNFEKGTDGWQKLMGLDSFNAENGRLVMKTGHWDPAITTSFPRTKAKEWKKFVVRMKVENMNQPSKMELFWIPIGGIAAQNRTLSNAIINDGKFHDYVFELTKHPSWSGLITGLRLDMCSCSGVDIEIEAIRFEK